MELITSLQNERVKLVHGLQTRARTRRKERKIALEGVRLILDAVDRGQKAHFVLYDPDLVEDDALDPLSARKIELVRVSADVMRHISDTQQPPGIVGVFPLPVPPLPRFPRRVLILDDVREPGNLGTILRTAAAAGTQVALLTPGCADPYNPKALRGGMGAHFRLPVVEAPWDQIRAYSETLNVYLTAGTGDLRYDQVDWRAPWAVIIGGEAFGAGAEAEQIAARRIRIPMAAQTESINAAVAAGVVLFEAARQNEFHPTDRS
jgi:TrmH family RNA methyltransferase